MHLSYSAFNESINLNFPINFLEMILFEDISVSDNVVLPSSSYILIIF